MPQKAQPVLVIGVLPSFSSPIWEAVYFARPSIASTTSFSDFRVGPNRSKYSQRPSRTYFRSQRSEPLEPLGWFSRGTVLMQPSGSRHSRIASTISSHFRLSRTLPVYAQTFTHALKSFPKNSPAANGSVLSRK